MTSMENPYGTQGGEPGERDWQQMSESRSPYDPGLRWDPNTSTPYGPGPRGRYAYDYQYEANRRTEQRRNVLWNDARQSMQQAANLMTGYRPGGAAAMASGVYRGLSNVSSLQAQTLQAPDMMIDARRHERVMAERRARRWQEMMLAPSILKPLSGAFGGALGQRQGTGEPPAGKEAGDSPPSAGSVAGGSPTGSGGGGGVPRLPGGGGGTAPAQITAPGTQPAAPGGGLGGLRSAAAQGGASVVGGAGGAAGGGGLAAGVAGGAAGGLASGAAGAGAAGAGAGGAGAGGAGAGGAGAGGAGAGGPFGALAGAALGAATSSAAQSASLGSATSDYVANSAEIQAGNAEYVSATRTALENSHRAVTNQDDHYRTGGGF